MKFGDLSPTDKFIFRNERLEKLQKKLRLESDTIYANYYNARFRSGPLKDKFLFLQDDDEVEHYQTPIKGIFEDKDGKFYMHQKHTVGNISVIKGTMQIPLELAIQIQGYIT